MNTQNIYGQKTLIKYLLFILLIVTSFSGKAQDYHPDPANLKAREAFEDRRFGLFIHWGLYSIMGRGEWVLNNDKIKFANYQRLEQFFNPVKFDAAGWVRMAKESGMKYITFVSRHHDGFSMWNTQYSDFNVMHTLYGKDILKMLADECHKQNMPLVLYYSLLDWGREDYPHQTGRTGQHTGRTGQGDYAQYLQFMKNQLTELLSNYGTISGIWLDGHWDQTNPEGDEDRSSRINWHYDELYALVHKLQPACLIGNNHHLSPLPGEDFQMFERDLPGENKSGLNFQDASDKLPVEVCETMNNSWGFNLNDDHYKSADEIIHYLINAAGRNTNLLLNVGPMPDGRIQPEFVDTLKKVGAWLKQNGEAIYGTKGKVIASQDWGTITAKGKIWYIHILQVPDDRQIQIPIAGLKPMRLTMYKDDSVVEYSIQHQQLIFTLPTTVSASPDIIAKLTFE